MRNDAQTPFHVVRLGRYLQCHLRLPKITLLVGLSNACACVLYLYFLERRAVGELQSGYSN
jgi:hypothetical protein